MFLKKTKCVSCDRPAAKQTRGNVFPHCDGHRKADVARRLGLTDECVALLHALR